MRKKLIFFLLMFKLANTLKAGCSQSKHQLKVELRGACLGNTLLPLPYTKHDPHRTKEKSDVQNLFFTRTKRDCNCVNSIISVEVSNRMNSTTKFIN